MWFVLCRWYVYGWSTKYDDGNAAFSDDTCSGDYYQLLTTGKLHTIVVFELHEKSLFSILLLFCCCGSVNTEISNSKSNLVTGDHLSKREE